MKREGEIRIPSGCAVSAVISRNGNKMTGEDIIKSMLPMHDRSNGLGGGFAGYTYRQKMVEEKINRSEETAKRLYEDAVRKADDYKRKADDYKKEKVQEAKAERVGGWIVWPVEDPIAPGGRRARTARTKQGRGPLAPAPALVLRALWARKTPPPPRPTGRTAWAPLVQDASRPAAAPPPAEFPPTPKRQGKSQAPRSMGPGP